MLVGGLIVRVRTLFIRAVRSLNTSYAIIRRLVSRLLASYYS